MAAEPEVRSMLGAFAALAAVNLVRDAFHGDWNCVIHPRPA